MFRGLHVLSALILLVLPASNTPYTHAETGMLFPPAVGPFNRVQIETFDKKGEDVGVGYNRYYMQAVPIEVITIYVYPMGGGIDTTGTLVRAMNREFEYQMKQIQSAHPGARLVDRGPDKIMQAGKERHGLKANYTFQGSMGMKVQNLKSELRLFHLGDYFVAYRISYPANLKESYLPEIGKLIDDLKWPDSPKKPTANVPL